ncbi:MAG TPA: ArsA family ATPase [Gemmatimonadaceae bacterium]|nr:ArsA family ATPase [Gemmatimonadaceae bacterium]
MTSRAAAALVRALPRTALVVGKGGVGKTTCAAALALESSRAHETLVITTDPARALPTVLQQDVGAEPVPVSGVARLHAQALDASAIRARFLARWGDVIRAILDRGTYLDDSDIGPLVETALPGGDEIFSALALAELMAEREPQFERVIVDTAPTGHTLRLLELPRTFRALVSLLDAMQEKHRFMVRALTRRYRADDADRFLAHLTSLVSALEDSLHDPARCAAVMVTNAQPIVVEETQRYLAALRELGVAVPAIVWNASRATAGLDTTAKQYTVPPLDEFPIGLSGVQQWLDALETLPLASRSTRQPVQHSGSARSTELRRLDVGFLRPLTIVAGKGGVGKTTVACALAVVAAATRRVLVVSTDPAPSIADALAQPVADADVPIRNMDGLFARQMDASAAFARLRSEYQTRVDALFDSLIANGVDLSHDRAIARDLLSLAPPGVDEVYGLSLISDALFGAQYDVVIVDPAPTGHLLRLLEMPELALAWTHQIMRLMLKYKDVAGLGESARDLLDFSRRLRALQSLLADPERCAIVLVTLDEPVVRAETDRLAAELAKRATAVGALVLNRGTPSSALPAVAAPVQLEAPAAEPPPVGTRALREWVDTWRQRQT